MIFILKILLDFNYTSFAERNCRQESKQMLKRILLLMFYLIGEKGFLLEADTTSKLCDMADIKALINERVNNGAEVVNGVVCRYITIGDANDAGSKSVAMHLEKKVKGMIPVTQSMIDAAEDAAEAAEKAAKKSGATQEDKDKAVELRTYADSLELGSRVVGMTDTIWVTTFDLLAILRNDPRYAQIADVVANADDEMLKMIWTYPTINILIEDVVEGQAYNSVYSEKKNVIKNNTVLYTLLKVKFHEESEDLLEDLKRDYRKELLRAAMENMKKGKKKNRSRKEDDDDAED